MATALTAAEVAAELTARTGKKEAAVEKPKLGTSFELDPAILRGILIRSHIAKSNTDKIII